MHRFYCNIFEQNGVLNEEESYHAIKVLRLNIGEKVICFDGLGHEWLTEIISLRTEGSSSKHPQIKLQILEEKYFKSNKELGKPDISIIVSLFKFDRLEFGLEKLVELGVDEVIFTKTKLSQFDLVVAERKLPRWKEIVISASKQSERKWVPLLKLERYEDLIKENHNDDVKKELRLVGVTEIEDVKKITEYVKDESNYEKIYVWIGPEGGFVKEELDEICKKYIPVKISDNVLRAETAMVKAISYFRF